MLAPNGSNFVVSFDDRFRVSTRKITSRSAVHRPLWCVHLRQHRSGHTDTVRSGPSQTSSNPFRACSQVEGLLYSDPTATSDQHAMLTRPHPRIFHAGSAAHHKLKCWRQASRLDMLKSMTPLKQFSVNAHIKACPRRQSRIHSTSSSSSSPSSSLSSSLCIRCSTTSSYGIYLDRSASSTLAELCAIMLCGNMGFTSVGIDVDVKKKH